MEISDQLITRFIAPWELQHVYRHGRTQCSIPQFKIRSDNNNNIPLGKMPALWSTSLLGKYLVGDCPLTAPCVLILTPKYKEIVRITASWMESVKQSSVAERSTERMAEHTDWRLDRAAGLVNLESIWWIEILPAHGHQCLSRLPKSISDNKL